MRNKPSIVLPDSARKQAVAALLLDFILTELGPSLYNQAIADARGVFEERSNDLAAVFHRDEFPSSTRPKP